MLRIGKLTDYAMLIMSQMAKDSLSILSATALADVLHLAPPTVSKILKMLSDAGLVTSIRGADGGYRLAKSAAEITVAEVIAAMEGELAMTECCESSSLCSINSMCAMRENWQKINKMIHSLLSGVSILDMLQPLSPVAMSLGKVSQEVAS
jgi:FeS assembly SUF system regulator